MSDFKSVESIIQKFKKPKRATVNIHDSINIMQIEMN